MATLGGATTQRAGVGLEMVRVRSWQREDLVLSLMTPNDIIYQQMQKSSYQLTSSSFWNKHSPHKPSTHSSFPANLSQKGQISTTGKNIFITAYEVIFKFTISKLSNKLRKNESAGRSLTRLNIIYYSPSSAEDNNLPEIGNAENIISWILSSKWKVGLQWILSGLPGDRSVGASEESQ